MDDVLTKTEAKFVAHHRDNYHAGSSGCQLIATIDRLVAEVERLRAGERLYEGVVHLNEQLRERNEKLAAVAKAADEVLQADGDHSHYVDELCERCRLRAALSALNPPTSDGSGGGA